MADDLFASGQWMVKAGRESEFVEAWTEFAEWTKASVDGAGWVLLLRDQERGNRFVSLGLWHSAAAIDAWRAREGFQDRLARLRELVDEFEATRLDCVSRFA